MPRLKFEMRDNYIKTLFVSVSVFMKVLLVLVMDSVPRGIPTYRSIQVMLSKHLITKWPRKLSASMLSANNKLQYDIALRIITILMNWHSLFSTRQLTSPIQNLRQCRPTCHLLCLWLLANYQKNERRLAVMVTKMLRYNYNRNEKIREHTNQVKLVWPSKSNRKPTETTMNWS